MSRRLAILRELVEQGGVLVCTPAQAPRVKTLIQLGGVVTRVIGADAVDDRSLLRRHDDAVHDELARLTGAPSRAWQRIGWALESLGWVGAASGLARELLAPQTENLHLVLAGLAHALVVRATPHVLERAAAFALDRSLARMARRRS